MALKHATKGYLNGVTIATADIEALAVTNAKLAGSITNAKLAGSITSDKLSKPYAVHYLVAQQATPAAVTGLIAMKMSHACTVFIGGGALADAGTSGAGAIDIHVGADSGSHHTVFGSGSKPALGLTDLQTYTAVPSGALGAIAAGGYLRVDVDSVPSGTKANLTVTVGVKTLLVA